MARTLIGSLILRLKAEGLGEGKRVVSTMKEIENAARTMGRTGVGSWGINFQKQLNGLKLAQKDMDAVQRSWVALHESMNSRNLAKALRSAEISHWRTNTISELAKGRIAIDRELKEIEKRFSGHFATVGNIAKAGLVSLGAYTGLYFGGMMISESLGASSERRREIFRQRMAGISEQDQDRLFSKSEEIGHALPSIPISMIMELSRSAFSVMGDADRAAGILKSMTESLVVMQSAKGPDAAAQQLIGLIRGLDNLGANKDGQVGIDQVNAMIDAATRAAQVDPDFDPATWFEFARRTKVAGPALSMDFLARAPVYIQDMGSGTAGNALAMMFKAFVLEAVGSAGGKKYLEERERLGIRQNGKLIEADLFGSDPDAWVLKHLIPALERDGVDMSNDTQVAAAVGKLSGNTNATALMTRMITQREQIARWLDLMGKSMGLDAAKDVRHEDPFVGWESFKKSLENLSAALIPIDAINTGLNGLADGINALAKAAEDNPALAALGIGGGAAAVYGAVKSARDLFGLHASAVALDGSAAALTRAAVALGGSAATDGMVLPDGKNGKLGGKGGGLLGWLTAAVVSAPATAAAIIGGTMNLGETDLVKTAGEKARWDDINARMEDHFAKLRESQSEGPVYAHPGYETERERSLDAYLDGPPTPPTPAAPVPLSLDLETARAEAQRAAAELSHAFSLQGTVDLDTRAVDGLIGKLQAAKQLLNQLGSDLPLATSGAGQRMRRNFADYGVAP